MKKLLLLLLVVSMMCTLVLSPVVSAEPNKDVDNAHKFLKGKFNLENAEQNFKTMRVKKDELGLTHVKMQQMVDGIPVFGNEYIVHFDKNKNVYTSNGKFDIKAKNYKKGSFIKANKAIEIAKNEVGYIKGVEVDQKDILKAELYLYKVAGEYIPTYVVNVNWLHKDSFGNWIVFVDAVNGNIVNKISNIQTGKKKPTPLPTNDTYEPNDSTITAYGRLTSGTVYNSYINSASDIDYYYFYSPVRGNVSVTCANLAGDYDLYLYNDEGTEVASSTNRGTLSESISYDGKASDIYYIKVVGYNGAYSTTQAYELTETCPALIDPIPIPTSGTDTTTTGIGVFGDTKTINVLLSNSEYYLYDRTRAAGGILTHSGNYDQYELPGILYKDADGIYDSEEQKAAVDAHYYIGKTYDYYKNVLGRDSMDGNGGQIKANVHLGIDFVNAMWDGTQLIFGDGDGVKALAFSGSLDIVAHEYTHGVTTNEANLIYQEQSGALNEAMSDILATAAEFYVQPTQFDWLLSEDIWTPSIPGDAVRSMADPTLYGNPAHMNDYQNLPVTMEGDFGGVHTNSGIINKAAYLIGTNVGVEKMGKIFYRALSVYMTSSTDFAGARTTCLQAAADLYGANSTEYTAVANAFTSVGIN